jgi:probable rRNA maturation factor
MNLAIYNWNLLEKYFSNLSFPKNMLIDVLKKEFSTFKIDSLNIVFTTKKHIKELNKEFRQIDETTDVLSFLLSEKPREGEIYICSECAVEKDEKEILRLIVHGCLHVLGYKHKGYFKEESKEKEVMFVKQEEILENICSNLNI